MSKIQNFIIRILPAIACALLIFGLSATPGNELRAPKLPGFDKFAHLIAYTVLGFLIYRAGKPQWVRYSLRPWVISAIILGCLYGASDEWHQMFVSMRSSSVMDWAFDTVGTILGVYSATLLSHKEHWRRLFLQI